MESAKNNGLGSGLGMTVTVANTALIVGGAVYFHKRTTAIQTEQTKLSQTINEMTTSLKGAMTQIRAGINNLGQSALKHTESAKKTKTAIKDHDDRIDAVEQKLDDIIHALITKGILTEDEAPEPFKPRGRRSRRSRGSTRRKSTTYKQSSDESSDSSETSASEDSSSPSPVRASRSHKKSDSSKTRTGDRNIKTSGNRSAVVHPINDDDVAAVVAMAASSQIQQPSQ
jgi:seryl-tRNA synthetase